MARRKFAIEDLPYRDELIRKLRIWPSRKVRAWIQSEFGDTFCKRTLQKWAKKIKEGYDFASPNGGDRKKKSPFGNLYLNKMLALIERKEKEIEELKLGSLPRERAEKTLWGFLKDLEAIEANRRADEPVFVPEVAKKEDGGRVFPERENVSDEEWDEIEKEIGDENLSEMRSGEVPGGVRDEPGETGRPSGMVQTVSEGIRQAETDSEAGSEIEEADPGAGETEGSGIAGHEEAGILEGESEIGVGAGDGHPSGGDSAPPDRSESEDG